MSRERNARRPLPSQALAPHPPDVNDDPFLLLAGTDQGNHYRRKRAIVQLEQMSMANAAKIRELRLENTKLRTRLERLKQEAEHTGRIEGRFEQLSSIIMDSQLMEPNAEPGDDEGSASDPA
jgi:hypothetical protein